MIEPLTTRYATHYRAGAAKVRVGVAYRCTDCGRIWVGEQLIEAKAHKCQAVRRHVSK